MQRRLANAIAEIKIGREYNYAVVNDSVDNAVAKIKAILVAERCKVERNSDKFNLEGDF